MTNQLTHQTRGSVKKTKARDCNLYVLVTCNGKLWLDVKKNETTGNVETQILGLKSNLGKNSKCEAVKMIQQKLGIEIKESDLVEKRFTNFSDKLNNVSQKCLVFHLSLNDEQHSNIKKSDKIPFDINYIKAEFAPGGMPLKQISAGILSQVKLS